jgi:imidazoleglycerol-phosphate dehydratase
MARTALIERKTKETTITLELHLDGDGSARVQTGIGFFDHCLQALAFHAGFYLQVAVQGDLEVDGHHTVEDVGICLGQALAKALGNKAGIMRYGSCLLPMDESLAQVALDIGGRPYLRLAYQPGAAMVGEFDTCLVEELFKGLGRALRQAVQIGERPVIPSTKGVLG